MKESNSENEYSFPIKKTEKETEFDYFLFEFALIGAELLTN